MEQRARCLTSILILTILLLSQALPATAQSGQEESGQTQTLLEAQSEYLEEQKDKLDRLEETLPEQTERLRATLARLSPDINQLIRLKSVLRSGFRETLLLSKNLEQLENSIRASMQPLNKQQEELRALRESLTLQREELKDQFGYSPFVQNLEYNLLRLKDIDGLIERTSNLEQRIERAKKPAKEYLDKLHGFRAELDQEVIRSWKEYYFAPINPLYSIDLSRWDSELSAWKNSLPIFVRYFLVGQLNWISYFGHLAVFWPLLFAICLLPCHWLARSDLGIRSRDTAILNGLFSLGVALILAYTLFHGFSTSLLLKTVWRVALSLALVRFLPTLRRTLLNEQAASRSPLLPLWALFVLSLCLQSLVFSALIKQAGSILLFAGGLVWLIRNRRRYEHHLERNIARLSPLLLGLGLVLSLGGWTSLALILVTSWFVLCIGLYLGSVTALLLKRRLGAIPDQGWGYFWQGVGQGIGVPLLWLLSLSLVIVWIGVSLGDIQFLKQISQLNIGWGRVSINLFRLLIVLLGMYLTYSCLTILRAVLGSASDRHEQIDAGTANSLKALTTYVVWSVYIIFALAFLGVNLTSLTVVAGGLSVGIGFGLQSIVSNFISGLILLFGRSIRPGDIIQIKDMWAEVKEINIRTTEIETFDRSSILMPNSKLISEEITNWTYRDKVLRRRVIVHVAYGSDSSLVKRLLLYIADTRSDVLKIPAPFVRFSEFDEGALEFTLYFFASMDTAWMTESELRFEVDSLFREYGIEFAIPQRGIQLKQGNLPPGIPSGPESGA